MKTPGKMTKTAEGYEVRFERHFAHSVQTVWEALTDPEKLIIWFARMEMDFVPGGNITIYFEDAHKTITHGKIIRIEEPVFFQFSWEDELATWELFAESPGSCRLVLTYSKLPATYALKAPAGWHVVLDHLEEMLNGRMEPYPLGAGETPEEKVMQAFYQQLLAAQFPELKPTAH